MPWRPTGIAAATVPVGTKRELLVDGRSLVLVHLPDGFFALEGTCPHLGGILADGTIERDRLVCPEHMAAYDIRTGEVRADPDGIEPPERAVPPLTRYPVRPAGSLLEIEV